jgi:hypothetical protein
MLPVFEPIAKPDKIKIAKEKLEAMKEVDIIKFIDKTKIFKTDFEYLFFQKFANEIL